MTKKTEAVDVAAFDLARLKTSNEAEMEVVDENGQPTGWKWVFCGPGHQKTIEMDHRRARADLERQRRIELSQINGRKYSEPAKTVDDLLDEGVATIAERVLRWSPVVVGGEALECTFENVCKVLKDPDYTFVFTQVNAFLRDERSFIRRSASN